MDISKRILDLLHTSPGLKAQEIARLLDVGKREVNSALYGALCDKVKQDNEYRWWLRNGDDDSEQLEDSAALGDPGDSNGNGRSRTNQRPEVGRDQDSGTPLARLCRYYIDCLGHELGDGVSVFASSRYEPDYVELNTSPFDGRVLNRDAVRRLGGRSRRNRAKTTLFVGYPIRLRHVRSRRGNWQGFMVDPVFLFPVEDAENGPLSCSEESPILNFAVLRSFSGGTGTQSMEDAIQLAEELGLSSRDGKIPDTEDLALRLQYLRPEWDWQEDLDLDSLEAAVRLTDLDREGIYNRAVLLIADRSPYTRGLEAELADLQKVPTEQLAATQLGLWITERKTETTVPLDRPLLEPLPLNTEQRLAVQRGLTQPLTVITGPPGTGKSQVVTSLLVNAAFQGKRVLFASKNNKAVDVVETRVNALGSRPALLRLGANQYRNRLVEYLTSLLSATATETDYAELAEHSEIHERLGAEIAERDDEQARLVEIRNRLDRLEREIADERDLFQGGFSSLRDFDPAISEPCVKRLVSALKKADLASQNSLVSLLWPFIKGARRAALQKSWRDALPFLDALNAPGADGINTDSDSLSELAHEIQNRLDIAKSVRQYLNLLDEVKARPSLEELAVALKDLTGRLASNSEKLWAAWIRIQPSKLDSEQRRVLQQYTSALQLAVRADEQNQRLGREVYARLNSLYPKVVETMSCWAVTSLSARGRIPLKPGFFDILIIDEASQCDIASAIPLLYRAKSAVIIGDPNQLRHISSVPVVKDRQFMDRHGVLEEFTGWAYSVTSLFDLASGQTMPGEVVALRDHHRSHADIIGFSNDTFYEGRLRVATRYGMLNLPARNEPAVRWLPVVGRVERPSGGGAQNRREADAVVQTLAELILEKDYRGTVGVVTPFRAQANLISKLVSQYGELYRALNSRDFLADTVHSFQGDERDLMVFSPVVSRGMPTPSLGFLRNNRNLFNVAVTRARAALWVVGDQEAALSSQVGYLEAFARYCLEIGRERKSPTAPDQDLGPDYPPVHNPEQVSDWERLFYRALYTSGIWAIPQYLEENYALDFAVFDGDRRLDIEVDGERYHRDWTGELCRRDIIRNQRLMELGWDVKRFWVYQIRDELDDCIEDVKAWIQGARS